MTRKKPLAIAIACLLMLVIIFLSVERIRVVNRPFSETDSTSQHATTADSTKTFDFEEPVDLSGIKAEKTTIPDSIQYRFSNPRIVSEEDIMSRHENWIPYYDSTMRKYDNPLYLQVDIAITNTSNQDFKPVWFTLETRSWSTIIDPDTTCLENGIGDSDDFIVTCGQEQSFTASYQLWEPTFSKSQWENVRNLPYQLVYLDYPEKVLHSPLLRR